MLTNKQEIFFFSFLGGVLAILLSLTFIFGNRTIKKPAVIGTPNTPLPFYDVEIKARAAYVKDLETGTVLFSKNENTRLPLASLVKIMSALVAREIAPEYSTVTITFDAIKTDGDAGLLPGERWGLKDLLDFSLVSSANDGMRAIVLTFGGLSNSQTSSVEIIEDFVGEMNAKARLLGMRDTYYLNDTGLDESVEKGGAYGSAKDQATLLEYILRNYPNLLSATRQSALVTASLDGVIHKAENTNTVVDQIPGLIASKTGFTDLAGGNLLIAYDPELGRPIIISVLGSTEEGRFNDVLKLIELSLKSVENSIIKRNDK